MQATQQLGSIAKLTWAMRCFIQIGPFRETQARAPSDGVTLLGAAFGACWVGLIHLTARSAASLKISFRASTTEYSHIKGSAMHLAWARLL